MSSIKAQTKRTRQLYQPTPTEPPGFLLLGGPNPRFSWRHLCVWGGAGWLKDKLKGATDLDFESFNCFLSLNNLC